MLDADLAAFIESPVMQIVGTADATRRPGIARGVGAWRARDPDTIDLVLSAWQWPETVANIEANGRIAVTFSRPSDYVTYQIKGTATLRPADDGEIERSAGYMVAIVSTLMRNGLLPEIIARGSPPEMPWSLRSDIVGLCRRRGQAGTSASIGR
jgi:predicted pyridoxine 5'-phosphate oxidase superfamily flavin-nucleotide-binding protein